MERKLWKIARTRELVKAGIPLELAEEQAEWEDGQEQEKRRAETAEKMPKGDTEKIDQMQKKMEDIRKSVDNGFRHVLALSDGTTELSNKEAAEMYGVHSNTIGNWRSGKVHCEYWPVGGRATMTEWRRLSAQYKASKKDNKLILYNDEIKY